MILQADEQNDLHTLVRGGDIDGVSRLLANRQCNVDAVDGAGMTALMHGSVPPTTEHQRRIGEKDLIVSLFCFDCAIKGKIDFLCARFPA